MPMILKSVTFMEQSYFSDKSNIYIFVEFIYFYSYTVVKNVLLL